MLRIKNLSVAVGEKKIIEDFNFTFHKNKVYALMGPNGSGKSTLAYTLMGHPSYEIIRGEIKLNNIDLISLSADKRAKLGLFLSFQSPLMLSGVNLFQLLRVAVTGNVDPVELQKRIEAGAKKLRLKKEVLYRSLNDGASGGERKKLELLQAMILEPKILILDEIDTGVDIDALKLIANFLKEFKKDRIIIMITHYHRILKHLDPDQVLVLIDGKLVKIGGPELAKKIDEMGYSNFLV